MRVSRRWWWRQIGLHYIEKALDGAARLPCYKPYSAALLIYTGQLSCGVFRASGKHDAKRGRDAIEAFVFEFEGFRVADPEVDRGGEYLSRLDDWCAKIDADDTCATGRQAARRPTGTRGDVEKTLAGLRQDPTDQMLDRVGHMLADLVVIRAACAPGRGRLLIMLSNALHDDVPDRYFG